RFPPVFPGLIFSGFLDAQCFFRKDFGEPVFLLCGYPLFSVGKLLTYCGIQMNFNINIPWFRDHENKNIANAAETVSYQLEVPVQHTQFNYKLWGWSLLSVVPWVLFSKDSKTTLPSTVNKGLRNHAQSQRSTEKVGTTASMRFRPYVCKVPWHTGARAFLSQLFPRYGHYCGPNWSSGKDSGSLLWDRRPIDWLDFCCYCHDIGYDTHDQVKLLEADLAFLKCLERPHMKNKGDAHVARLYKTMCITGLKNVLIPYRRNVLRMQSGQCLMGFGWLSNIKWRSWSWGAPKNS
ncbi:hypothetical protein RJ641_007247, partial [Dillenia turbinata]